MRRLAPLLLVLVIAACAGSDDDGAAPLVTTLPAPKPEPLPASAGTLGRTYTVRQVRARFRAVAGLPLVRFADGSTAEVTSLRTRPHGTARFGEFQLFVFRPAVARRMTRRFTQGRKSDAQGIYWIPDRVGGWIALTLHGRNLAVGWFPTDYGAHAVDERWVRLQAAVARIL